MVAAYVSVIAIENLDNYRSHRSASALDKLGRVKSPYAS